MYSFASRLEWANAYSALGLRLFPCHTLENNACSCGNPKCSSIAKHPLTEHGVKDATTDKATLVRYFSGDYSIANIGLACGKESGVIVLDADSLLDLQALTANEPMPTTWVSETGKGGRHYYFRYDQRCEPILNAVKFAGALDIRTNGGYVILPPSNHASGKAYRWLIAPNDCALASLPDWLLARLPSRANANAHERTQTHTLNEPNSQISHNSHPHNEAVNNNSVELIVRESDERSRLVAYLAACPPAIQGQGGMNATFRLCCYLVRLFANQSDDAILSAMSEWNARCVPSWSENDLRRKIADARQKVGEQRSINGDDSFNAPANDLSFDAGESLSLSLSDNAFIGPLGGIVKALDKQIEADKAGLLVTLLVCFGHAVGNGPSFSVAGGNHNANLFAAIVGDTASGKGVAWSVANSLMKRVADDWQSHIGYGMASGEGLIERLADTQPQSNTKPPSSLFANLTIAEPKRLLCVETEASKPITAMRREGSTLSGVLRSAWDGQPLEVMTRGQTALRASNAFLSVIFHLTGKELASLLSGKIETFNGFANRFLWCLICQSHDLPNGGNLSAADAYIPTLRQSLAKAKAIRTMERSTDADRLWESVYPSLKRSTITGTERARPQVLRLSMIYALSDGLAKIEQRHLEAALSVWRYCEESAARLFGDATDSFALRVRSIVRQSLGITRTDLRKRFSHNEPTQKFDDAIRWLVQRGEVIVIRDTAERYYPAWGMGTMGVVGIQPPTMNGNEQETIPTITLDGDDHDQPPTITQNANDQGSSHDSQCQTTPTMTLAALIDWKNENGVRFVANDSTNLICLPPDNEYLATPAIKQAIADNQETLSLLVSPVGYSVVTLEDAGDGTLIDELALDAFDDDMNRWRYDLAKVYLQDDGKELDATDQANLDWSKRYIDKYNQRYG